LFGALVAFGGTYLLQRGQFRRRELEDVEERLGLIRRLRADLQFARMLCEGALKSHHILPGVQMPVDLWIAQGHRGIAAIHGQEEQRLLDVFGRIVAVNGVWAAAPDGHKVLTESEAETMREEDEGLGSFVVTDPESLENLIKRIDAALPALDAMKR